MTDEPTRRTVLKAAGAAGIVALAGCTTEATSGETPTETDHGHADDHETDSPTHHDHEGHSHGEIEGPRASAEVRMLTNDAGTHFDPHVVWVEEGATVTWINESGMHTTTAYGSRDGDPRRIPDGAATWDSGMLTEQGAVLEHTFETPGVYDYYCAPHEGTGMIGSVIVGEPDPHDQPGLAEPQEGLPAGAREKIHSLNEQCNQALGHTHDEATPAGDDHHEDDGHHEATPTEHHDDGHDH